MSGLRGRSAVAADHRSALPQIPGLPWWGAAILAVAFAALGVAYDAGSGNQSLGGVFAAFYVLGCVLAILAVRQSGVFTAVIQPPLILFIAVPTAYFVFHGSAITGIKDLLINCGYPLIERFPLMFFTAATVLLIGMLRWYLGAAARRAVPVDADAALVDATPDETDAPAAARTSARRSRRSTTERPSRAATASSATGAAAAAAVDEAPRAPRRSSRTAAPASQRSSGAAAGTGSRRSRHARPPETETIDPASSRPRRRNAPPVDPTAEPRRRPRAGETREPREPREGRESRERRPLPPLDRRSAYERPERTDRPQRRERPDPFEQPERSERPDRSERPKRRPRVTSDYEPYEPPPTSRPSSSGGTHHPVSRVRYRDAEDGESRTEHRSTPRPSRHSAPESWEYDV